MSGRVILLGPVFELTRLIVLYLGPIDHYSMSQGSLYRVVRRHVRGSRQLVSCSGYVLH